MESPKDPPEKEPTRQELREMLRLREITADRYSQLLSQILPRKEKKAA